MTMHNATMRDPIPAELRERAQWVCCRLDKIPLDPRTGQRASVGDPTTWATFEEAVACIGYAGVEYVGFVLTASDSYAIIDLDDKPNKPLSPAQRNVHARILEAFDSYTEHSASGCGYHIIVRGSVPSAIKRDAVEVYAQARYMICTGDVVKDRPIVDCQAQLDALVAEMQPSTPQQSTALVERAPVATDEQVLAMATGATNGAKFTQLWRGDWQTMGYPSQSEADNALLALLCFYSPSNEQVMRLFRRSGLGQRQKAKRDDYLLRSIAKIRAGEPPHVEIGLKQPRCAPAEQTTAVHAVDISAFLRAADPRPQQRQGVAPLIEGADTVCLAQVQPRTPLWLWRGRLAVGEMTLLTGSPGVGKCLLLCYIVACYTTGRPMHGDRSAAPVGHVLWVAVEDAHDTALVPRLQAAGADLNRVEAWLMDRPLSLPNDTARIIAAIARYNCGLAIIDPAPTLLDREHSSNNDADVRRSFAPLATACREHGCCLILVRHTNKRTLGSAMDRGGGSIGWTGMARNELMLGRLPTEEGAEADESIVTLAPVKSNLGKWSRSLDLRIVEVGESARVDVVGETDSTANDLCLQERPRLTRKTDEAASLLRRILGDGQEHCYREIREAAKAEGISYRTLERAKAALGIASVQRAQEWWWRLVPANCLVTPPEGQTLAAWGPGGLNDVGGLTSNILNNLRSQTAIPPESGTPGGVAGSSPAPALATWPASNFDGCK